MSWGIHAYPICARYEDHLWADRQYSSFAEAVEEFLHWETLEKVDSVLEKMLSGFEQGILQKMPLDGLEKPE